MRWGARAAVVLTLLAGVAGRASALPTATGGDFAVRLIAPVDASGSPSGVAVAPGVPFRMRVELSTTGIARPVSVSYDLELPSLVHVASQPIRVVGGAHTSTCLRSCTVGWNAARTPRLSVYYTLVLPGPGVFVIGARIVGTTAPDRDRADDAAAATIRAAAARLTLGPPRLLTSPPRRGRSFAFAVSVRRGGASTTPRSVRCVLTASSALVGRGVGRDGEARCAWRLPRDLRAVDGRVRAQLDVRAGHLRARGSWSFAVAR